MRALRNALFFSFKRLLASDQFSQKKQPRCDVVGVQLARLGEVNDSIFLVDPFLVKKTDLRLSVIDRKRP